MKTNEQNASRVEAAPASHAAVAHTNERMRVLSAALAAAVFGTFLLLGIGFSHASTIHNATHDARHAFALPCH